MDETLIVNNRVGATHMELHFGIVVIVVHTEGLVFGQDVQQLPLSLVHEHRLVLFHFLRGPH